ncbi:hypothetical protein D358_00610 [Enterococcus faecalis RP2S-4]|uniref:Uncharacterized protein n=1 Tax=Enterococcus faecalis RP2S-4 TaxID=1244145 RepID=A0ABC9TLU7_ENTFL|nr:hypothetical protein D358_00610 [Enterococcus faecalis RP2S-4]
MSGDDNAGGLVLAASPMAKKSWEFLMLLVKMKCLITQTCLLFHQE